MFGDLMGNMQEKQEALQKKLAEIKVEAKSGDGAVTVVATANRQIVNIHIDKEALDWDDKEQVEDLVLVAVNKALALAAERETAESQNLIQDLLPPGLGNMSDLFG